MPLNWNKSAGVYRLDRRRTIVEGIQERQVKWYDLKKTGNLLKYKKGEGYVMNHSKRKQTKKQSETVTHFHCCDKVWKNYDYNYA